MINRPLYTKKIMEYVDTPFIKILTGIRRSGKSTILKLVMQELKERGIDDSHIVSYRFDSMEYDGYTAKQMYQELKNRLNPNERTYLFLDEVQEINNWEKIINSLATEFDVDIYITGSNSRMLSSEIATYLTGRYVSFRIYTLSFAEYLDFKSRYTEVATPRQELINYIKLGGFPAKTISDYMKSEHRKIDNETVYSYLEKLEKAYILHRCQRYDLNGKELLKTQEKFYLADTALRYSVLGYNDNSVAAMLENVVYLELCRRGYRVDIGKIYSGEIDFVATKQNEKLYIQVTQQISSTETEKREYTRLLDIDDNFPKYVLRTDEFAGGNYNGVKSMHVADFLLSEEY